MGKKIKILFFTVIYIIFSCCPDQPLVFRLDLEDLHFPLLLSIESFGFFVFPLWHVLVPCIAQNQGFVTQHILWVMLWLRLNAFFQEGLCESLCFRAGARLKITLTFLEIVWPKQVYNKLLSAGEPVAKHFCG